jgi:ribonucleoside-triphosphate reductase
MEFTPADTSVIPTEVEQAFKNADRFFPHEIQKFQFFDKYSRFNYELGRRETWIETVDRAVNYLTKLSDYRLPADEYNRIRQFILEMKASPSMRLLAMAGEAAERQNIAIYNCSYLTLDSIDSFVEEVIIAMAGCGVGYSVEHKYVDQLPEIPATTLHPSEILFHTIEDSTEGWAAAFRMGLEHWFAWL